MPEKFIALTALCAALGLPETSDEAAVTAKLKEAITPSKELTALSALVKDGKVIVLDTVSDLDSRLKKIEEAGTKQIATLSATIDGKVVNFTAEDVVKLSARFDALENKLTAASTALEAKERTDLIARFSAEGKVPKGEDGKELSNEQLETFNVSSLKLLLANTPATVPLNARGGKAKEGKNFGELKGIAKAIAAHAAGE